jgi:DNA-binding GntR family transcriptional regulator
LLQVSASFGSMVAGAWIQFEGRSFERGRRRITEQHRAILRAVERGDAKGAGRLLREHLTFYGS